MRPEYRWMSPTAKVQFITQRKRSRKERELRQLQLRLLDFVRKLCTLLALHDEVKPACTSFLQTLRSLVKFFIKYVLEPMLKNYVRRLYGKEASKVILHMDSASSHLCPATYDWLDSHRFKYMTKLQ